MNVFQFYIKYSIHHPLSADTSFKFLAIILFEIRHLQNNFIPCLSKGRNLTRGDNSGKNKNTCRLFFHVESIHEVSRRHLHAPYTHTYTHTDKPKPICPPLFQSWGPNNGENLVATLAPSFLIGFSSFLQLTRKTMKS